MKKTSDGVVGTVVLRLMSAVMTPPAVSLPVERSDVEEEQGIRRKEGDLL